MIIEFCDKDNLEIFFKDLIGLDELNYELFRSQDGYFDCDSLINESIMNKFTKYSIKAYHLSKCNKSDIADNGLQPFNITLSDPNSELSQLLADNNLSLDFKHGLLKHNGDIIRFD